jgi:aspartate carbamoyltransferase regulatory subunit
MEKREKTVSVAAIKDGTVIDHIPSGQALKIIYLLQLSEQKFKVTLGLHLSSSSMSHKDILKIEDRFLTEKETHDIAVFAPTATINIIKNYKVSSKIQAKLPKTVKKILICPNLCCITRQETVDTLFSVEEFKQKVQLHCFFCEKIFERDEIKEYRV